MELCGCRGISRLTTYRALFISFRAMKPVDAVAAASLAVVVIAACLGGGASAEPQAKPITTLPDTFQAVKGQELCTSRRGNRQDL